MVINPPLQATTHTLEALGQQTLKGLVTLLTNQAQPLMVELGIRLYKKQVIQLPTLALTQKVIIFINHAISTAATEL